MSDVLLYFKTLYKSKTVLITTTLFSIMYYIIIEYIISLNATSNFVFVTIPLVLIYLLVLSSAVLLTISLHSIKLSLSKLEEGSVSATSLITTIFGGVAAGCNCSVPILSSVLYVLSFNAATVSTVTAFVGNYQIEFFCAFIVLNFYAIYYHLGKLSHSCTIRKGKIVRK